MLRILFVTILSFKFAAKIGNFSFPCVKIVNYFFNGRVKTNVDP